MLKGRFQRFNGKSFIVLIISVYRICCSSFRGQKKKQAIFIQNTQPDGLEVLHIIVKMWNGK